MSLGIKDLMPYVPLVILTLLGLLLILRLRRFKLPDKADRVFRHARLRVPKAQVQQLREEFARAAVEAERRRVANDDKQQAEFDAIQREKARILHAVRNTPQVIREVGQTLQSIEQDYQRSAKALSSDRAREALRLTAERQIQEVLQSVLPSTSAQLPAFELDNALPIQHPSRKLSNTM